MLKSEQKWHISALNYRKKKRTLKSHRQKFKINSRQPHKNRSRSTGVSWHARWAPRNSSCYRLVFDNFTSFKFCHLKICPPKYLIPLSQPIVTTRLPGPNSFARASAATTFSPVEPPAKIPSSCASLRHI